MAKQPIKDKIGTIIGYQDEQTDGTVRFYNKVNAFVGSQSRDGKMKDKIGSPTNTHPFWSNHH